MSPALISLVFTQNLSNRVGSSWFQVHSMVVHTSKDSTGANIYKTNKYYQNIFL